MICDTIVMNIVIHENGLSVVWNEPVVIRGDIGPAVEKKPKPKDEEDEAPAFEAPSDVTSRKMAAPFIGMLETMHQAAKSAQDQIIYRLIKRVVVCTTDDEVSAAVRSARGSQRVLLDLNRRGAHMEEQLAHHGPQGMPIMIAAEMPGGPRPGGPGKRGPRRGKPPTKKPGKGK